MNKFLLRSILFLLIGCQKTIIDFKSLSRESTFYEDFNGVFDVKIGDFDKMCFKKDSTFWLGNLINRVDGKWFLSDSNIVLEFLKSSSTDCLTGASTYYIIDSVYVLSKIYKIDSSSVRFKLGNRGKNIIAKKQK